MLEITSLCGQIRLGKRGENLARVVYFDEPVLWEKEFGTGVCELIHQRNGDKAPYPIAIEIENGKVCWKVSAADTAIAGEGRCELRYIIGEAIVKSKTWTTEVIEALGDADSIPPEPQKAWVDQVLTAAEEVKGATTHQPMISNNGNWYVWDAESTNYKDSGISAKGTQGPEGPQGEKGQDGQDYILTEADKQEIADIVLANFTDVSEVGQ